jgi:hypothetical protein
VAVEVLYKKLRFRTVLTHLCDLEVIVLDRCKHLLTFVTSFFDGPNQILCLDRLSILLFFEATNDPVIVTL